MEEKQITLPKDFEKRMQDMLKEAYPAFIDSYNKEKYQALRLNPLKTQKQDFLEKAPFELSQVPWEEEGFYYDGNVDQPGKHPYHMAGVYYIQEPSAMAPVVYLDAKPGEKILDMCAAPGGKSTQIAAYMKGKGILVSNEINSARAKILSENVERMGIRNTMVTNEAPKKLSEIFDEYFDKILVDAPCSGEGMFRKNEEACTEWSLENVELCATRQDEILDCAADMLRPGGRLVYSTCTFAPAENEGSISRFLDRHSEFFLIEVPLYEGMEHGVPEWSHFSGEEFYKSDTENKNSVRNEFSCEGEESVSQDIDSGRKCGNIDSRHIERTIRLWPHKVKGEGHFLAVLQKSGEVPSGYEGFCKYGLEKGMSLSELKNKVSDKASIDDFAAFTKDVLKDNILESDNGGLIMFGGQLYMIPKDMPSTQSLKILRPGLHLGTMKKNRFEPSHALSLALRQDEVNNVCELTLDTNDAQAYINGQTLSFENKDGKKGWFLITIDGYSLGWGKLAGNIMKNHYPKGLRK